MAVVVVVCVDVGGRSYGGAEGGEGVEGGGGWMEWMDRVGENA